MGARPDDPVADYLTVRRELHLYNPEYCARPHVVALNKADLLAADWGGPAKAAPSALEAGVLHAAQQLQVRLLRALPLQFSVSPFNALSRPVVVSRPCCFLSSGVKR